MTKAKNCNSGKMGSMLILDPTGSIGSSQRTQLAFFCKLPLQRNLLSLHTALPGISELMVRMRVTFQENEGNYESKEKTKTKRTT